MSILPDFFDHLRKERRVSDHTIRNYKSDLAQMLLYMSEEFELDDLCEVSSTFLRSWVVRLMKDGKSPRSIHRKISSFRTFVKFARRKGKMKDNPIEGVVLPKIKKRLPNILPEHVMDSLFSDELFFMSLR